MKRVLVPAVAVVIAATAVGLSARSAPGSQPRAALAAQEQPQRPQQPPLGPNQWRLDANHSAAHFSVRHLMVSTVRGRLGRITGTLEYDGKDVTSIKADVTIDVNGIDTQNENRDKHLRTADFFDVANHPTITFKSRRVEPGTDGQFKLIGDLTIRGTTKEVVLDVEGPSPISKGPRGVVTGATATTRINRLEYGLKWNNMVEAGPVVSDEVRITIDIEAHRPATPGTAAQN